MNRMTEIPAFTGAQRCLFTASDYSRMIEAGVFGDRHVELVDGELVEMSPS
ncbi:MAG: hypothetical protein AB7F98_07985 [Novosphingobium sp.]